MELLELTSPQVNRLPRHTPIIFPVAALEQHGPHMPLFTDSILLQGVLDLVKQKPIAEQVLFAPLQWLGNSEHHLDHPGTMSASPRVYLDLLRDQAENFLCHGFTRLVFINGHGGNIVPMQQATFELRQKYRQQKNLLLLTTTYWTTGGSPTVEMPELYQQEMGHACEWETSMMLHLRPNLVQGNWQELPEVPFGQGFTPAHRAWVMPDRSAPGYIGHPAKAAPTKGAELAQFFAGGVVNLLEKICHWNGEGWDA
ncbi:MAG: creatininase family protein [Zavarzinella sp.]